MDPDKNLTPDATNHLTSEPQPISNPANAYQPQPAAQLIVPSQPTSISMSPQKNSEYPQEVQPSSEAQSSIQSTNTMAYSYNTINASNPKRRIPRWLKMILGVAIVLVALFALAVGRYLSSFQTVTYKEKQAQSLV
ncbi:hypothetical protein IPL68_00260 [Candidatus Saccharibacteria bacterium]|nr:MAG: hypothetical protein IPL68_00260 [Candidatus Saccharibacteria bacterium]